MAAFFLMLTIDIFFYFPAFIQPMVPAVPNPPPPVVVQPPGNFFKNNYYAF
jgi:hypothetical protein